jgi:serine/threonine protein kinase
MELVCGGELYDYIINNTYDEDIVRSIFHQLIDTLEFCHSKGVYHRDIKPENILLDGYMNIKLADFGNSFSQTQRGNQEIPRSRVGTNEYMAPEVYRNSTRKPYSGPLSDIFSAGVLLFVMCMRSPPFGKPSKHDAHYRLLCSNKKKYWGIFEKR